MKRRTFWSIFLATLIVFIAGFALLLTVLLPDAQMLHGTGTEASVWKLLYSMIKPIVFIFIIAVCTSGILASGLSDKIVKPLNKIDFDHMDEIEKKYMELTPLFEKIKQQKGQIGRQMTEMRRKQEEFETVTANMSEGFLVVNSKLEIVSYNAGAVKLLKIEEGTFPKNVSELSDNENFCRAVELAVEGTHNEQSMQFQGRMYQLIANPVYQENEQAGAVLIILDVTEKEERDRLRREFTANVSHELKTPLTSISGTAEIIANGWMKQEDISHFAGNIYTESQRLITLIEDIMKLSRLDENAADREKEEIDLYEIAEQVVERLRPVAERKHVTMEIQGKHVYIMGTAQIMDEMIHNLCDNAVKYNKEGGSVTVLVEQNTKHTKIIVKDTGIGIPQSDLSRVFERFYRVDKNRSKEIGGTGLGLSIVKHGAAYHNATVSISSQMDVGTTVTILL